MVGHKIKHIFSDMDGTLLDSSGQVSEATQTSIKTSTIPLTLTSARAPIEMNAVIEVLNLKTPQIAFNGGMIFKKSHRGLKIFQDYPIDLELVYKLMILLSTYFPTVSVSFYDDSLWYVPRIDRGILFEHKLTRQIPTIVDWETFCTAKEHKVYKIMIIVFESSIKKSLYQFLKVLDIPQISIHQSGEYFIELTIVNADKALAIRYIMAREHLKKCEVAGFGDSYNDVSMLQLVGTPMLWEMLLKKLKNMGYL